MNIKTFIDIEMAKIRNSPMAEHGKKIHMLVEEGIRLGHNEMDINILITENIVNYLRELANKLRTED